MDLDLEPFLRPVTELVRSAGDSALDWYRRFDRSGPDGGVENKAAGDSGTGFDPVTEADRAVETRLRAGLSEIFPDHAIFGEEFGLTEPDGDDGTPRYRWTIDPIDGTRAFITGQPMWGTLVGLQDGDRPIAGWMHVPTLAETFVGRVAHLDGGVGEAVLHAGGEVRPIATSAVTELGDAIVMSTHPSMFEPGPQAEAFGRLGETVKMVRFGGDCLNYGLLAMGLSDLVVENGLAAYDIVPLIPIIEAAGGVVTDLDGARPMDGGYVVAASTPELHRAALELLAA